MQVRIPLPLSRCYYWCKGHPLWAGGIGVVATYWIGFDIYYCSIEGCTHPANWWFHLSDEPLATWLGSLGALTAVWWGFFLFSRDRREKRELARKRAMPVAVALNEELDGILRDFDRLGVQSPQAAKALQIRMNAGSIEAISIPKLEGASANSTFLESIGGDEVDQLFTLLKSIRRYNDLVSRQGGDVNYGGSTAGDLLNQYETIKSQVGQLGAALAKYRVLPSLDPQPATGED